MTITEKEMFACLNGFQATELSEQVAELADDIQRTRSKRQLAEALVTAGRRLWQLNIPESPRLVAARDGLIGQNRALAVEGLLRLSVWCEGFAAGRSAPPGVG